MPWVKCEFIGRCTWAGGMVTKWNAVVHPVKADGWLGFYKMPLLLLCHCWPQKEPDLEGYKGKHPWFPRSTSKGFILAGLQSVVLKTYKATTAIKETLVLMIWFCNSLEGGTYK